MSKQIKQIAKREAISYGRFSSDKQESGDSIERQARAYQAVLNRYAERGLVESERYGYGKLFDKAKSGWTGANLADDASLGQFLAKVKSGEIKAPAVLVIDDTSRLGRLKPMKQVGIYQQIVEAGIAIAVNEPDLWIDEENINDIGVFMTLAVQLCLNYDSSQTKSRLVKEALERNRTSGKQCGKHPFWVSLVKGKFTLNDKAPLVKEAIRMAIDGKGARIIGEATGLPRSIVSAMRKPWVMGVKEYFAEDRKTVIGTTPGYYPALVDGATYARLQNAIDSRVTFSGHGKSTKSPSLNLFTDLVKDADGERLVIRNRATGKAEKVLRKFSNRGGFVVYANLEKAILKYLRELHASDVAPHDTCLQQEIDTLEGELASFVREVKEFKASAKPGKTTAELASLYDTRLEEMSSKLESLKRQNASKQAESLEAYKSVEALFASAPADQLENLRIKAKALIGELVKQVQVSGVESPTMFTLSITLASGVERWFTVDGEQVTYAVEVGHKFLGLEVMLIGTTPEGGRIAQAA